VEAVLVLVRLVAFAAGTVLFGAPLFMLYSLPKDEAGPTHLKPALAVAGLITAAAAGAAMVVQTGLMAGDPVAGLDPATLRDALGGGFGISIVVRMAAGVAALALFLADKAGRHLWTTAVALGALALGALAWSGHGAADDETAGLVHAGADVIHLLAAGVWLGALLGFGLLLTARPRESGPITALYDALKSFAGVGSAAVATLIASGLVNSWFLVGPQHVANLADSLWGGLMIAKLVLFTAMLGFAGLNRFRLTPRLAAAMADDPAGALSALRRSIALESGLGLAVLALVAALGVLAPPASA
jgi:putative copper resistance protein D